MVLDETFVDPVTNEDGWSVDDAHVITMLEAGAD